MVQDTRRNIYDRVYSWSLVNGLAIRTTNALRSLEDLILEIRTVA